MDTQRGEVSWLESFPPDIWAYFACYIPGEQLGRLKMTGAKLLWQRLKSPHVVTAINLGLDFIFFKSFPGFINDFTSVEEMYFHSRVDDWSLALGLKIDSIPSGVRKLKFGGKWNRCADTLFGKDDLTLKLSEHLPHLEVLDLRKFKFASYTWMTHSPQSLTKLRIRLWDGSVELPTSLIHFQAYKVDLSTASFVSKLPPSLETFKVRFLCGLSLVLPLLPPSTRKLYVGYSPQDLDGIPSLHNILEQLPKSLTWLKVPTAAGSNFVTNPELISLLPSTLTELDIFQDVPCSSWQHLPQQLAKLTIPTPKSVHCMISNIIDSRGVPHQAHSIPFEALSRTMTSLEVVGHSGYICCPLIVSSGSYFPPQLTTLKISGVDLSLEAVKLLPSSLSYLEIGILCERVCKHLPNRLKTLISTSALMTPNLVKYLPKSLTSLVLPIPRSDNYWIDYDTGKHISCVSTLPEYSIQQSCMSYTFDWKDDTPLPSTLTQLKILNAKDLGDAFMQRQKLPNLLELDFEHSNNFTDLSIPLLSPHLISLDLGGSSKISGKSFPYLSRSLTFLNLNSSESIFDSDIQHLPRTLMYVFLSRAIHLTDLCIPDLPPHLEMLNMEFNSQISPSSFVNFPYPLRSSQAHAPAHFGDWIIHRGAVLSL